MRVAGALRGLGQGDRALLDLAYRHGLDDDDVARAAGVPELFIRERREQVVTGLATTCDATRASVVAGILAPAPAIASLESSRSEAGSLTTAAARPLSRRARFSRVVSVVLMPVATAVATAVLLLDSDTAREGSTQVPPAPADVQLPPSVADRDARETTPGAVESGPAPDGLRPALAAPQPASALPVGAVGLPSGGNPLPAASRVAGVSAASSSRTRPRRDLRAASSEARRKGKPRRRSKPAASRNSVRVARSGRRGPARSGARGRGRPRHARPAAGRPQTRLARVRARARRHPSSTPPGRRRQKQAGPPVRVRNSAPPRGKAKGRGNGNGRGRGRARGHGSGGRN